MCKPGDDIHDMSKEAIDMEAREGLPDRRRSDYPNGNWKPMLTLLIGLVVGFVIPRMMDIGSGSSANETLSVTNEKAISALSLRLYNAEQVVLKGGAGWTTGQQLSHALEDQERFATIEAFDAAMGQELKDIKSMMIEIARKLNTIEANQRRSN